MKKSIIFLICLIINLFLTENPAHAGHYIFKQISIEDGLSSMVHCIHAEKKGFVWIGTKNGLRRFDGHELKQYVHQSDNATSLPSDYIHKIEEDSLHNIWVFTDRGLAQYCRKEDNFHIPHNSEGKHIKAFSSCEVKGGMLFGTCNRIYRYDYATNSFSLLQKFDPGVNFVVHSLNVWDENTLLCHSRWYGVLFINIQTGKTSPFPFDCGKEITDMMIDSKKRIWISPYNNGILCFGHEGNLIASYTTQNSGLSNNVVLCMTERDDHLWIGTDGGGIDILDPESKEITVLERIPGNNYSLPVNSIYCLYNDAYDNMWAGSIRGGLISIREASMKTYTDAMLGSDKGLSENAVISLFQEPKSDIIWVGTDGGGINKFDTRTEKFTHYPQMWGSKIASICEFDQKKLLLSLFTKGFFLFDKETGNLQPLNFADQQLNQLMFYSGKTINLYKDTPGSILLMGDRIYRYTIATRELSPAIQNESGKIAKMYGTVLPIIFNSQVTYLHDLQNIYELDHSNDKLKKLFNCKGDTTFNCISQDNNGIFWIGGKYGLSFYNPQTGQHQYVATPSSGEINSVICDQRGKVWAGTDRMLFAWLINEKKFIIFGESDGVINNEYLAKSCLMSTRGDVFLGGVKGLLHINRELPIEASEYPELQLTDIMINGESVYNNLEVNPTAITVPWGSKSINIKIMSCEKDIFRQKIFRYQISGLNDQGIESSNPELVIRSLPSGTYQILASCSTKDGGWTPKQKVLSVTILPPWYLTWWFILLSILLIAGCIIQAFLVTMRRKDNKLKWAMKEHEQKVYEDKVRFLINISHELRTPLTLIHAPLSRLLKTLSPDEPYYLPIKGIYRQSQRMKDLLNMVLNLRKMEVGETKLQIKPYPMNEWIKEVSEDFRYECEAKNILIRYELDEQITIVNFDKEKCVTILTNLLINALKHSPENSEIIIRSKLNKEQQQIRISVIDQGCGLNMVDTQKLFTRFYQGSGEQNGTGIGLSYSKILVELQGGKINAHNNENIGATFYFDLPIYTAAEEIISQPKAYLNELISNDHNDEVPVTDLFDTKSHTVLVVDDNQDLIDFLENTLKEHFKKVYTANDGIEALQKVKTYQPDIVVSDVMMPRMNGYELCKLIKENIDISHIPVILLTARDDEQSQLQGYKIGADAYLIKPFEEEMLLELIRNRLRNREKTKSLYRSAGLLPQPEESTFSQTDENFLLKLNTLINENLCESALDINFLCNKMCMSRSTLYNKLKALTDMGANDYINKIKMEKAKELIITSDLSFMTIAEQTGFTTSRYFSTIFKQYTGETPTQYKERNRTKRK